MTATATLPLPGSVVAVLVVPFCTLWTPLTDTDTLGPGLVELGPVGGVADAVGAVTQGVQMVEADIHVIAPMRRLARICVS